jgi:hypothetical protein
MKIFTLNLPLDRAVRFLDENLSKSEHLPQLPAQKLAFK